MKFLATFPLKSGFGIVTTGTLNFLKTLNQLGEDCQCPSRTEFYFSQMKVYICERKEKTIWHPDQ